MTATKRHQQISEKIQNCTRCVLSWVLLRPPFGNPVRWMQLQFETNKRRKKSNHSTGAAESFVVMARQAHQHRHRKRSLCQSCVTDNMRNGSRIFQNDIRMRSLQFPPLTASGPPSLVDWTEWNNRWMKWMAFRTAQHSRKAWTTLAASFAVRMRYWCMSTALWRWSFASKIINHLSMKSIIKLMGLLVGVRWSFDANKTDDCFGHHRHVPFTYLPHTRNQCIDWLSANFELLVRKAFAINLFRVQIIINYVKHIVQSCPSIESKLEIALQHPTDIAMILSGCLRLFISFLFCRVPNHRLMIE